LYARTDRFYLKEFEADTNTNVAVLLDISPSMRFGSGAMTKLDYARALAASLLWFSNRQRDRVGLVTFDTDVVDYVPCSAKHLQVALQVLQRQGSGVRDQGSGGALINQGSTRPLAPPLAPLEKVADDFRRRGILIVISDLYDEPERVAAAVGRLRGRGSDVIVMHVLDRAELDFPYDEETSFRDLESGERMPVVSEQMREQYRAMVAAHIEELRRLMRERGFDYLLVDTSRPLDIALFDYLAGRQRLARVR
ncbi:MAG TPA: DUF58 domain-containing protein, partial [Gemmatimonadaceae bacterium]|nr:DUF58 domain-containing protein [Gemmatimonadaceae bacterium]